MREDWFARLPQHPLLRPEREWRENGGAELLAKLQECRRAEQLAPAELAREQSGQLRMLARHAATHSPYFAGRLRGARLTPTELAQEGGLSALPPMTRAELRDAGEPLFCRYVPSDHGEISTTMTSGSTGEAVTVRRTALGGEQWMAYTLRDHLWHQRDFAGRLAVVRANLNEPMEAPDWGAPCQLLFQTGPASVRPVTWTTRELHAWLADFRPAHLLMLPSVLAAVVSECEQAGQALESLQTIRTVGETVSAESREAARRVLGLEIQDSYSSQEAGFMAMQCPQGSYHVAESIVLEVLDERGGACAPGEVGRVVVTDLQNYATPLIRYEIGDYAEVGQPCACGRGLPVIRRFLGRERNLVILQDGSRHWPLVGFHRWDEVLPIRQYQFVQLDRETIVARMVAEGRPDAGQEARLTAIIQQALGFPFRLQYEWHEAPLPRGPGGKFEEFQCRAV